MKQTRGKNGILKREAKIGIDFFFYLRRPNRLETLLFINPFLMRLILQFVFIYDLFQAILFLLGISNEIE